MQITYLEGSNPKLAIVAKTKADIARLKNMVKNMREDSNNNGGKFSFTSVSGPLSPKAYAALYVEVNY